MQTQSTFETWDFSDVWSIDASTNDGYPYLLGLPEAGDCPTNFTSNTNTTVAIGNYFVRKAENNIILADGSSTFIVNGYGSTGGTLHLVAGSSIKLKAGTKVYHGGEMRCVIDDSPCDFLFVVRSIAFEDPFEESILIDDNDILVVRPNPASGETYIDYSIDKAGYVKIQLYSMAGQLIAILTESDENAGFHTISFDAGDLPSGVYNLQMVVGDKRINKMLVVRR
jgi:hypothetical protein